MLLRLGLVAGVTMATVVTADSAYAITLTKGGSGSPIPNPGSSNSGIVVSASDFPASPPLIVNKVSVSIFGLNHARSGEVSASLSYSNGGSPTVVSLFGRNTVSPTAGFAPEDVDGNEVAYIFEDGGSLFPPTPVNAELPGGTYSPATPLSTFNSFSSVGTWTLSFTDHVGNSRSGSFQRWELALSDGATPPTPIPTPCRCSSWADQHGCGCFAQAT